MTALRRFKGVFKIGPGWQLLIGIALVLAGFGGYYRTLAPTVLDGDAALFQFTPQVLGVTYPTGYPIYLLFSRLWLTVFPWGEIAWRMNLFSAICAALALPGLYFVARRLLQSTPAALVAVLTFATLPTYWRWATEAKIYTLNMLLFSMVLSLAVLGPLARNAGQGRLVAWLARHRYKLGALCLGLQIGVHSTTVLLLPGILLLFWLDYRRGQQNPASPSTQPPLWRILLHSAPFFIVPAATYLYVPLRAEWLIAQMGRLTAIQRGLLADFYHSGWQGWVRYFTAADFTGGVVTNWGKVPAQLGSVYLPLLQSDFGELGTGLGFAGLALVLLWPSLRARFWPLLLVYAAPIPFVLTYGQGEQSAFLLTSNVVLSMLAGVPLALIQHTLPRLQSQAATYRYAGQGLVFGLMLVLVWAIPYRHSLSNINWLESKWNTAQYDYWFDVLQHPLRPGAGVLAEWGDLTSMWYMQHTQQLRPDLHGLYPPTEATAAAWLAEARPLYIAGPTLDTWAAGVLDRYTVLPWGRLVLLAPPQTEPQTLLPTLPQPIEAMFEQQLQLQSFDYDDTAQGGELLYASFAWQALSELPRKTRYSLRLVQGDTIIAQKDDNLRSGWFPRDTIPGGQPFVGTYALAVPPGTPPGSYQLQLAIYSTIGIEWRLADGQPVLNLGAVDVAPTRPDDAPGLSRFGGTFSLDAAELSASRAGQGKGFAVITRWRALRAPEQDYQLEISLVDNSGRVWRSWQESVATRTWQPGQQIRYQVDVTVPAEAPVGPDSLAVRVRWLDANQVALTHRRGWLPGGDSHLVGRIAVEEKENRSFVRPDIAHPQAHNFGNRAILLGYDGPDLLTLPAESSAVLPLTLYWQGRGEMREVYFVFVHLLNSEGQIVAQHDGLPGGSNKHPTTGWAVGEVISDPLSLSLPPGLPSGTYTLVTGLYLPPQGPRLPLLDAAGQIQGDQIPLGTTDLRRP